MTKKPSLAETHPDLAAQAIGWDPRTVRPGSNRGLQWKCSQGHIWKTMVNARTQGHGCVVCTNRKVVSGFNDLATSHPSIASEAHGWDSTTVTKRTPRIRDWKEVEKWAKKTKRI